MSIKMMSLVWGEDFDSLAKKLVLLSLADHANDEGYCWPSVRTIAKKSSVSERWVSSCITELEKSGWVEVSIRNGKSNYYRLTPPTGFTPELGSPLNSVSPPPPPLGSPTPPTGFTQNHKEPPFEPPAHSKQKNNPRVFTRQEVDNAKRGDEAWTPEVSESDMLPGGWDDYAEQGGVKNSEALFSSWRKFKDLTVHPYQFNRWKSWLKNEQSFHKE